MQACIIVFSSVNEDGTPNITPIGSLVLADRRPAGFYFDVFNSTLAKNVDRNPNIAVLAVDNRKLFWLKSVYSGRFSTPPAIRLMGTVGAKRPAAADEVRRSLDEIKTFKRMGASKALERRLKQLREIVFTRVDIMNIGEMTNQNWHN